MAEPVIFNQADEVFFHIRLANDIFKFQVNSGIW